ncbi:RNA polymerase sigma factor [Porphyrobacter sp. ULC335]|uniref:RNA polymerase sigma factor n=1 Tax=Porphyrobacter sp. ULC335 TaxID=2854260 RepID=UPI002220B04B|nr:sigma-70 family RNA polymerase sigma factor [Porphyrobacter sp. ULC335]UYV15465.1 sigma-70 family RNA polymerase sigma factor [Porphyrobacter sp. ULC335]
MADQETEARIDHALVARALLADDRRAFEQLVRRHQGMVRAQLRRLLHGDIARADDLAQETFLLAWRKLNQFRGEARFSTWLYRIAYSCFLQSVRKRQHLSDTPVDDPTGPQLSVSREVTLRLDMARALRGLSEAEQAVLLHVVQLGLSHEEAAYVLSMPLGTVKSHAKRGKDKLRARLADWQDASLEETGS